MKILVTGASGNVGKYVVQELIEKGEDVVAGGNDIVKIQNLFEHKVDYAKLDFTDEKTFEKALEKVDRVFLMRPPHLGKPEDLYPFIECMKSRKIKMVSFLSLMGVEKNTIPPHHKIEKYVERLELPYAHIRPSFFMQNISGVHSVEIKERNEIFIPAGKSKISFIDTKDIGLAIATVLHHPEKYKNTAHTLTGPEALDFYQIADILSEVTGKKILYRKPGFLRYRSYYIRNRGLDKNYVNVTVALYFMTRMGTAEKVTDEYYRLTERKPRTFREFAMENINCFI